MKRIIVAISLFNLLVLAPLVSYAQTNIEVASSSSAREIIERGEEQTLGSENHAALEKVEPIADNALKSYLPITAIIMVVGISIWIKKRGKF